MKKCEFEPDKLCNNCDDCIRCDLNPEKICDNCELCISDIEDFRTINLQIIEGEDN